MGRPVMTIDTVHATLFSTRNLLCAQWTITIIVFHQIALTIFHLHPRDDLPPTIACDVSDLVAKIHMPVNTCDRSSFRITTSDVNQHALLTELILFVVGVGIECAKV